MTSRTDPKGTQWIYCAALAALLASATSPALGQADQQAVPFNTLATAVMRVLENSPVYQELLALYEQHRRQEGDAWTHSVRGRRMLATLESLRAAATSSQVERVKDKPTVTVTVNGRKRVVGNVPISTEQATIDYAADQIADLILRSYHDKGLILYLPPAKKDAFNTAMARGYEAATQQEYLSALRHFETAREIAPNRPELYYNLGLAESKIPGRELRAIAWFGAYLSMDTFAPNAAAVKEQMIELSIRNQRTLSRVMTLVESEADRIFRTLGERQGEDLRDGRDISIRDKKSSNLRETARLWAESGDRAAALKTTSIFRREEYKTSALIDIIRAQAGTGDIAGAHKTTELLDSDGSKSWAQLAIVEAYVKNGNVAAAQATAELIHDPVPKQWARHAIANGTPMVPGRYTGRDACYSDWLFHLDESDRTHDAPLNSAPFLNLSGHLKSLSTSDDPQAVFDALRDTADTLIKVHRCITGRMMKQQAAESNGSSKTNQSIHTPSQSGASPMDSTLSGSTAYTYNGRQIVLSPDMVFDVTGKVASAHVTRSPSDPELGVSAVAVEAVINNAG